MGFDATPGSVIRAFCKTRVAQHRGRVGLTARLLGYGGLAKQPDGFFVIHVGVPTCALFLSFKVRATPGANFYS